MSLFTASERPVITVMVNAKTEKRALELIAAAKDSGADAFGIQMDTMPRSERTVHTVDHILKACGGKPLYICNYAWSQNQGVPDETLAQEQLQAAESGAALIDLPSDMFHHMPHQMTCDPSAVDRQMDLIRKIHEKGSEALISAHTGCFCDPQEVLRLARMQRDRGADICKIVVWANSDDELEQCFQTELLLRHAFRWRHLFLCGGKTAKTHRIIGPLMGSCLFLCVVEQDDVSAKSQPLLSEAYAVMRSAHLVP